MLGRIYNNIKGDKYIWYIVLALNAISLLLVYSSTRALAYKNEEDTEYYLLRHGIMLAMGLFITYQVHRIDHRYFSRLAQMMLIISIPLLIYTMFFGVRINDASRWVRIPVIGFTFQSSDFAKLALLMYTSCGWFFNDLAGIETVQILRYAARAMDLYRQLGEDPPEAAFLDVLSRARSNDPAHGDGRQIWHDQVLPR